MANKSDGKVVISTALDNSGLPKGIGQAKGMLGGLSGVVTKLGGVIAAAFSVKVVADFAKECLDLGSDLQEVQNVVDVTFTTMNEQVNEFARNAARTAGLSETMAKKYTGTFGAMAKSFKFTEAEAYEMSTALTQMSGDVASFYNLSQDEAYTKLKSVFTGETESLKDLGVVMTQTALDSYALANGFGKTTSQMTEQEKVALRYRFVMEQLTGASGDFVRTSDSWANQTKLLSLQFDSLKASIGQGLINVLTPVIKMLNTLMSKLQVVADAFRDFTTSIFGSAGDSVDGAAKGYAEAADGVADLADNTEKAGKAAKKALAGFDDLNVLQSGNDSKGGSTGIDIGAPGSLSMGTVTVGGDVQDEVSPKIQGIIDFALEKIRGFGEQISIAFQPTVSSWSTAFSSLLPAVQDTASRIGTAWTTLWDTSLAPFGSKIITEWIPSVVNTFSETFAPIFADVMPVAMDTWATNFENKCLIISEWTKWLGEGFDKIKTIFTDMCESIKSNWDTYGGGLLAEFQTFVDGAWDTWWKFYDEIIAPVFEMVSDTVDQIWEESLKPLWDKLVDFVLSVGTGLLTLWNTVIKPLVDWIITFLGPVVESVAGWILETVKDTISVVTKVIGGILDSVKKVFNGIVNFLSGVFTGNWKKAWGGVVDIFKGLFGGIVTVAKGYVNTIILALNTLIGAIYSGISGVVNGLGNVVSTVGKMLGKNWGFSIPTVPPKIPYLAQGAVLPPNKPFLAMVGDQKNGTNVEAPLATIQEALAEVLSAYGGSGDEAVIEKLDQILSAILSIEVGDTTIGKAANRYNEKMAIIKGRA